MSNKPRRRFLREMKEKLIEQGIFEKRTEDPMILQQLSEKEARQQFLHSIIVAFVLVLLLIALPMSF